MITGFVTRRHVWTTKHTNHLLKLYERKISTVDIVWWARWLRISSEICHLSQHRYILMYFQVLQIDWHSCYLECILWEALRFWLQLWNSFCTRFDAWVGTWHLEGCYDTQSGSYFLYHLFVIINFWFTLDIYTFSYILHRLLLLHGLVNSFIFCPHCFPFMMNTLLPRWWLFISPHFPYWSSSFHTFSWHSITWSVHVIEQYKYSVIMYYKL